MPIRCARNELGFLQTRVREKWGKLSEDDLETIAGHRDRLEDKIQERSGSRLNTLERKLRTGLAGKASESLPNEHL